MKIVYIGNKLSKWGKTPQTVELLTPKLSEFCDIYSVSSRRSVMARFIEMIFAVFTAAKEDIVLIDTYSTKAFWYAYAVGLLAQKRGLRYIPILHGGNLPNRVRKSPRVTGTYINNASEVVCPSNYLKDELEDKFDTPFVFIPNFIDINLYTFRLRDSPNEEIHLLWVRSFHSMYNPLMAVKILTELLDMGVKARLTMVGPDKDGSLGRVLAYIESRGIQNYVDITGLLTKSEWIRLSSSCDIFINTTNVDNTPVSVLEAMALGMIVISTNVGGLPYIIENNNDGFLLPPNNSELFVDKIHHLIGNPQLWTKLSYAARLRAETWSWEGVVDKWSKLIGT